MYVICACGNEFEGSKRGVVRCPACKRLQGETLSNGEQYIYGDNVWDKNPSLNDCHACGQTNQPGSRFCNNCNATL